VQLHWLRASPSSHHAHRALLIMLWALRGVLLIRYLFVDAAAAKLEANQRLLRAESKGVSQMVPKNTGCDSTPRPVCRVNFSLAAVDFWDKAYRLDRRSPVTKKQIEKAYRHGFEPECRTAGRLRYWSCNVEMRLNGEALFEEPVSSGDADAQDQAYTVPHAHLEERHDCDSLHWLAQEFINPKEYENKSSWSIDVGSTDGECGLNLVANGHHVTFVDALYEESPDWRAWVQMSLDANGWSDRASFAAALRSPATYAERPTIDQLTAKQKIEDVAILKLDVDGNKAEEALELFFLLGANATLKRTSFVQIENDGWRRYANRIEGHSDEIKLLNHLCANGLQPYGIFPDVSMENTHPKIFQHYLNSPAEAWGGFLTHDDVDACTDFARLQYEKVGKAWTEEDAFVDEWRKPVRNFHLEPICYCNQPVKRLPRPPLAALCAFQILAVQTNSQAAKDVSSRFGSCNA
jgi:hypothetical protein